MIPAKYLPQHREPMDAYMMRLGLLTIAGDLGARDALVEVVNSASYRWYVSTLQVTTN